MQLGVAGFENYLLAKDFSAVILSDNENSKQMLRNNLQVESFGSYTAALHLHQSGKITDEQFMHVLFQLIDAGYVHIPSPPSVVWNALEMAGYNNRKPFTTAALGILILKAEYLPVLLDALLYQLYTSYQTVINRSSLMRTVMKALSSHTDILWIKTMLLHTIEENNNYPIFYKNTMRDLLNE